MTPERQKEMQVRVQKAFDNYHDIVTLDGCEYILYKSNAITHKGDCKNPIHNKGR
jgi:hypothetical protein